MTLAAVEAAIDTVHPQTVVPKVISLEGETLSVSRQTYDLREYDRLYVVGGGNVAGETAAALETIFGDRITRGVIITDVPASTETVKIVEASYPIPSYQGMSGAREILEIARQATEEDILLTIVSGGGSALLPAPTANISLDDLRKVTNQLYEYGLNYKQMNTIRKHISEIKGGRLAKAAAPATTVGLVFCDVTGNESEWVASGPISPDSTSFSDAISILERHDIPAPDRVRSHLEQGYRGFVDETPGQDDDVFEYVDEHRLADTYSALASAEEVAENRSYNATILWSHYSGNAVELAKTQTGIVREIRETGRPVEPPAVVLTGGDLTVSAEGRDGFNPNQLFALSAAIEWRKEGLENVALASVATDGIDAISESSPAGALVTDQTVTAENKAREAIKNSEASSFVTEQGDAVLMGPTGTNVNDIHVLVVGESGSGSNEP